MKLNWTGLVLYVLCNVVHMHASIGLIPVAFQCLLKDSLVLMYALFNPFFFFHFQTNLEVFRKDSKKLPIGDPDIDWEETVYLNLIIHQFEYTLTLATCTRTSPKHLQILKRYSQVSALIVIQLLYVYFQLVLWRTMYLVSAAARNSNKDRYRRKPCNRAGSPNPFLYPHPICTESQTPLPSTHPIFSSINSIFAVLGCIVILRFRYCCIALTFKQSK